MGRKRHVPTPVNAKSDVNGDEAATAVAADGRTTMTDTLASPAALTAADRCDRCGAAARVRAVLSTGGELVFCNHHAKEHGARLEQLAAVIHRSRDES